MLRALRKSVAGFRLKRVPWALLAGAVLLALIGALFIASAQSTFYARRHVQFLVLGVLVFCAVALFDYRHLASLSPPLYGLGLAMLALLPVLGISVNNARRWYDLGPVRLQPSEPVKYVMIIVLATYFTYTARRDRLRDLVIPLLLTVPPMLLIIGQPDLGSAMLFLPTFLGIAFLACVPMRNLVLLVLVGLLLALGAWFTPGALKDYQKDRVISFIDPERNPTSSASYNTRQATLAVAGGGLAGQGWGEGLLNRLRRVPERHTDFIFPVIAEEWGFARSSAVILLYLLLFVLMARIVNDTDDLFGRLLAGGVLTIFAFQSLLHIAISLRLAPITGLTLPLMSYGGSSLVSTFAGLGLVASVALRGRGAFSELGGRG